MMYWSAAENAEVENLTSCNEKQGILYMLIV